MPYPYFSKEELEARLSASVVRRILDDNNNGESDTASLDLLREDASSRVAAYLPDSADEEDIAQNTPHEIVRLSLDVAVAYAAQRHPEVLRLNWKELWEFVTEELQDLRDGKIRIGNEPEPPGGSSPPVVLQGSARVSSLLRRGW